MPEFSFKRIVAVVSGVGLLAAATVAGAIWKLRGDALEEAARSVAGMAGMLAEQVQQSSQAIDFAINETESALVTTTPGDFRLRASSPEVLRVLAAAADKRSSIDLISIEDAQGGVLATSRGAPSPGAAFADAAFESLRGDKGRAMRIGALRASEATGEMVVDLLKRLETDDGRFLGAMRIGVKPGALVSTYSPIAAMPGRSYALFARDGRVLARFPASSSMRIGQSLPRASQWYDVVARGGGEYRAASAFDHQDRIIAARAAPYSPFVVSVSVTEATVLAHWRAQSAAIVLAGALALLIAGVLTRALALQFRKLADKETKLRAQSEALALSNARFAAALGSMSQALVVFDKEARVVISNDRYATLYGLDPVEIQPGMSARDVLALRAARGIYAGQTPDSYTRNALSRRFTDRRVDHLNDGRSILINHSICADGGIVVTHEDITEREQANARIAHMAMHDELTQLANRALFLHTLTRLKEEIGATCAAIVVTLIDLDDFKPVNDTRGHAAGDAVLRDCAARILSAAPQAHVVARLGGDEFALATGVGTADVGAARAAAQAVLAAIRAPYAFNGQTIEIDACAGVAVIDATDVSTDDMLRRADLALYSAKATGAGLCRSFEPQMELEALTRRELAADLAQAIAQGALELAYQPVVDADTLEIRQMEALLRWRHPRLGPIAPLDFIKLAEETSLIVDLGRWAIERACADAARWPAHVGVAVNVSPLQLVDDDFAATALAALERAGLPAGRLELEITESVLLQDKGDSLAALRRLQARGVAIALDDFGTGFSSMSYLKRFPFDKLKIDRSFVADAPRDPGSAAIVAATAQLARAFEIEVTAEGVETYEQYQALRAAGVRLMQGYLFGRPGAVGQALPAIGAVVSISGGRRVA